MFDKLLIGKELEVLSAHDKSLIGRVGTVRDETKNTLEIEQKEGMKIIIPKSIVRIKIRDNQRTMVIEGKTLLGTPVERIRG